MNAGKPVAVRSGPFLLLLAALQAQADDRVPVLPAVEVTEGAHAASTPTRYAASGNSTERLDREDLNIAHEHSVYDVLQGHPGVALTKGGEYGAGMLYLRGVGGFGTLTWDGMPLPDTSPGTVNLSALMPDALDEVRVTRGYAARPFAPLGGAVELVPHRAKESGAELLVEAGSFAYLKETLRGGYAGEKGDVAVAVNRTDSFDGSYWADKFNGNPERDRFDTTQATLKTGWALSDAVDWEASLLFRDFAFDLDAYGLRRGLLDLVDQDATYAEQAWIARNGLTARVSPDWNTHLELGYSQQRNRVDIMGLLLGYDSRLYLARWENDNRLWSGSGSDAVHVVWGAEGRHEGIVNPTFDPFTFTAGTQHSEERTMQSGFLATRFAHGPWSGEVGVRHENYDRFGSHALLHAGAAWQVADRLRLSTSGGNGLRIPSHADLFWPLLGNPALKPERSAGGDLGLEWKPLEKLTLNATGFFQRYDDLIVLNWQPLPQTAAHPCVGFCSDNVANATVAGIETGGEIVFDEHWRGGASYTYTDSENLASGRQLPVRPKNSARAWGEWRTPGLPATLWLEAVYRGKSFSDLQEAFPIDAALFVNARADYKVSPRLSFYVRVENLTDVHAQPYWGFNQSGTAAYGGFLLKLF